MKGLETNVKKIRMKIFEEIADFSFRNNQNFDLECIVKKICEKIEKDRAEFKGDFELKKEALFEMVRLVLGVSLNSSLRKDIKLEDVVEEKHYYELPLVNVIRSACNGCDEGCFFVTNSCKGCLARPCQEVCLKDAIFFNEENKSQIDSEKCVKCARCAAVCPYSAIVEKKRPCSKACGMDAITIVDGKAKINVEKCVSCGACVVSCPFGAIFDKSQIFQLIWAIKNKKNVVACVAPAFVGQFGKDVSFEKVKAALKEVGFVDVVEVAVGADMCSYGEAKEFVEKVPKKQPFMATSCCPAWSVMAKKNFKDVAPYVSMELTPMVFTARLIKSKNKDVKVAFIGPCAAKKLEAFRKSVRSDVDFVLTFEEMMGIFKAKNVDFDELICKDEDEKATGDGRNFAVTNGVATAVLECVKKIDPKKEIFVESAQGLSDCKKLLLLAKAGKKNGFLLEGMACKGGCVGGPGTLQPPVTAKKLVNEFANKAKKKHAFESEFIDSIEDLICDDETKKN